MTRIKIFVNNHPYKDRLPIVNSNREAITQTSKVIKTVYQKYIGISQSRLSSTRLDASSELEKSALLKGSTKH